MLLLNLEKLLRLEDGRPCLHRTLSTSRVYIASDELCRYLPEDIWSGGRSARIGDHLAPETFSYRRQICPDVEGPNHQENNLINPMPWIVTSANPLLVAAQVNTQAEFDRTFRTVVKAEDYRNKKLLFISCLNIDISPQEDQLFPLTKCVPWAAYLQDGEGGSRAMEQPEIVDQLLQQSTENPDQIDLESAIRQVIEAQEIRIAV